MNNFNYTYRYTFCDKDSNELYELIENKKDLEEINKNIMNQMEQIATENRDIDKIIFRIERYNDKFSVLQTYVIGNVKTFLIEDVNKTQRIINKIIKEFREEREISISDIDKMENKTKIFIQNMIDMLEESYGILHKDDNDEFRKYICKELDISKEVYNKIREIN